MTNLFARKSIDVIRVLLVRHPKAWVLRDLAREADVSLGQAFKVTQALINERLAVRSSTRSELKLADPAALLKRWAAVNNFTANNRFVEYYSPEEDLSKFLTAFKGVSSPGYAFSGLAGALIVAPFVRPTNVHLYVDSDGDAEKIAKRLRLMPVEEQGNVKFVISKSKGVYYGAQKIDDLRIVSNVQLYVDLLNYPARGEEAAGEVLKVIKDQWMHERAN